MEILEKITEIEFNRNATYEVAKKHNIEGEMLKVYLNEKGEGFTQSGNAFYKLAELPPVYMAMEVSKEDVETLTRKVKTVFPDYETIFCEHMTLKLAFDPQLNGKTLKVDFEEFGTSDTAVALKTNSYERPMGGITHITLATRNGAAPVSSNFITNWVSLPGPITVTGETKPFFGKRRK